MFGLVVVLSSGSEKGGSIERTGARLPSDCLRYLPPKPRIRLLADSPLRKRCPCWPGCAGKISQNGSTSDPLCKGRHRAGISKKSTGVRAFTLASLIIHPSLIYSNSFQTIFHPLHFKTPPLCPPCSILLHFLRLIPHPAHLFSSLIL